MKKYLIIGVLFLVSSCTQSSDFSCPAAKSGNKCNTIAESDTFKTTVPVAAENKIKGVTIVDEGNTFTTIRIVPKRIEEKIGKVWFAPYQDEEGNFYDESYAYIVVKPAKWQFK